ARLSAGDRDYLNLGDLTAVEMDQDLSATNILFPVLNLLSANDVGVLRREFVEGDEACAKRTLSFDDARQVARTLTGGDDSDWADRLSIRWALPQESAVTRGGRHGQ
ncbi:MAG: hypothetical protein ACREPE_11380, partial [Lysobacter sp.]